eukprot:gene13679-16842_t
MLWAEKWDEAEWKAAPTVGNGYRGRSRREYVAGVYNFPAQQQSQRALFPATVNVRAAPPPDVAHVGWALDMRAAVAMRRWGAKGRQVEQRWVNRSLLVTELDIDNAAGTAPLVVPLRDLPKKERGLRTATDEAPGDCFVKMSPRGGGGAGDTEVVAGVADAAEYSERTGDLVALAAAAARLHAAAAAAGAALLQ